MRLSRFFLPTLKEAPSDAQIVSHQLMLRAGMIKQEAAGIYAWLPLGLKVLRKVEQIVREEQTRAGAVELLMPTLQLADLWRESGRYDAYGPEMLRITDRHERELLYGPTNEEMVTDIFRAYVKSYKSLPLNLFHIQWKFRDERRPRFGVMRGREFLMKDAYSFDLDEASARVAYNRMFTAYLNTFARIGLKAVPMRADTGPIGGDLSHEFIVLAETGESEVFCDRKLVEMAPPGHDLDAEALQAVFDERTALYAATEEMHDQAQFEAQTAESDRLSARGIEVGHIFYFGTKYSGPMKAKVAGPDGQDTEVHMGSYGVGVSRLLGAIIEASHDEGGIIWPDAVAPFDVVVINLRANDAAVSAACEDAVAQLEALGKDVLYDDTDERPGGKFATADLIGVPWQLTIGPKGLADGVVELKRRATGEKVSVPLAEVIERLTRLSLPSRPSGAFSSWEIGLALRYLRAKRKEGGVATIAVISFIGIMLAVAVLISVMSIMSGFRSELLGRMLAFNGHMYVQGPVLTSPDRDAVLKKIEAIPGVYSVNPLNEAQSLIRVGSYTTGVMVKGIRPQDLAKTQYVFDSLSPQERESFGKGAYGGDRVLIGAALANSLGIRVGDAITVYSPTGADSAFGNLGGLEKTYFVGGLFRSGAADYDRAFMFMPLEQQQLFFGKEGVWDAIEIKVDDPDQVGALTPAIRAAAGPGSVVSDWRERLAAFYGALKVERVAMSIILGLVVAIAAMNIISGIVMLVKNKGRDIAILRTIGASPSAILRVFFMAGAMIGVAGTLAGLLLGLLFCWNIGAIQHFLEWVLQTKLFDSDVYMLDAIPALVDPVDVTWVAFWSLLMSCIASLPPSWNASRIDPVEALRYE